MRTFAHFLLSLSVLATVHAPAAAAEPAPQSASAALASLASSEFSNDPDAIALRKFINERQRPAAQRLEELFKLTWEIGMRESPEYATMVGYPGLDDRWSDLSPSALARSRSLDRLTLEAIRSIDAAGLKGQERINFELFETRAKDAVERARFPHELLQINALDGVHQSAAQLFRMMPKGTVAQLENQLARLERLPALVDQTIELLREGVRRGVTPPRITLRAVPDQVRMLLEGELWKSPLLCGFKELPDSIPSAEQVRLKAAAERTYRERVIPSFERLESFLRQTYLPGATEQIALSALPDGQAWYAFEVRQHTTTSLSPEQIHQIGLAEVKRIRAEMEAVKTATGFKGDLSEFFTFLRTDPRFYFTDKEALLRAYRDIAKRIDPELGRLFRTLPRLPYGVTAVPSYAEGSAPTAYYESGSPVTGRAGMFFANTDQLETRPTWGMEALTLHEAVPGHHLQISLALEQGEVPEFRKHAHYTAYIEGWGLYAESLGGELGLYRDDYMRFGRLSYEMWRAVRLVVDTGMHALGWSRDQAIDFFKANSGKAEHEIVVEVDRYLVWPGQALAYKIGELKLKELRARAERELGPKFDIRSWHDEVLAHGAVPLELLERDLDSWVQTQKIQAAAQK